MRLRRFYALKGTPALIRRRTDNVFAFKAFAIAEQTPYFRTNYIIIYGIIITYFCNKINNYTILK